MAGYFDVADWTELSESSPRTGRIRTLQYHHSTVTVRAAARALYAAGGRVVSPNGQVHGPVIYGIVPQNRRAFTSGVPAQDQVSYTLEVDNETLGPDWLIPATSKDRIAQLMVDMFRNGDLEGLWYGQGGLLEHHDVPGTYATACAGPDANSAYIISKAKAIYAGAATAKESTMQIKPTSSWTNPPRARLIFDGRQVEVVTDPARVEAMDFAAASTNGLPYAIYAKVDWDKLVANFPPFSAGGVGGGSGPTLAQIVAAVDAADDAEHAAITAAITTAAKAGGTPADFVAALKTAL